MEVAEITDELLDALLDSIVVYADKTTIQTADNIIRKSNSDSYSITLDCIGCLIESIGRPAVLDDDMFGRIENLTVRKIRYTVGSDGEKTTVTLGKERF